MTSITTCLIVADDVEVADLLAAAPGAVVAVVAGPQEAAGALAAGGVPRVLWLDPAGSPVEALALTVADAVAGLDPDLVLARDRPSDRVLAGAVAARLGSTPLSGVVEINAAEPGVPVTLERNGLGGVVRESLAAPRGTVVVLDRGGVLRPSDQAGTVEQVAATPADVAVVASSQAESTGPDLSVAARVVGVGRGLRSADDLPLVDELARALGAATACSRPLAEGQAIFPKDRYIGVSGRTITPDLYLALGISGQVQHMVGARGARTIVAVNTDRDAPVVAEADYVVVGDLYTVVPALTAALRR